MREGRDRFRTEVVIPRKKVLTSSNSILSLGSCFAENLGSELQLAGFDILVNPYGTLFHPNSIFECLDPDADLDSRLFQTIEERAHHLRLPKTFYASTEGELIARWTREREGLRSQIEKKAVLLITLGTSFFYEWQLSGSWVANCLQLPQNLFQKKLSRLDDLKDKWDKLLPKLPTDLKIIVTVSPVRHIKDGLAENMLSKSLLRLLAEHMVQSRAECVSYFPAYEILCDELRDYRFYKDDMLHPSPVAVQYIYEKFQESYCDEGFMDRIKLWRSLKARQEHRLLHPESDSSKEFKKALEQDLARFEATSPRSLNQTQKS